jgi:hypothetical protein
MAAITFNHVQSVPSVSLKEINHPGPCAEQIKSRIKPIAVARDLEKISGPNMFGWLSITRSRFSPKPNQRIPSTIGPA